MVLLLGESLKIVHHRQTTNTWQDLLSRTFVLDLGRFCTCQLGTAPHYFQAFIPCCNLFIDVVLPSCLYYSRCMFYMNANSFNAK